MKTVIEKILQEIEQFMELEEAAYLGIDNSGELIPVYKRDTKTLTMEEWVKFHKKYRSFVQDNPFLMELVEHKKNAIIKDTNKMSRKPVEFQVLGIQSIYLFPVVKKGKVIGILDLAYIDKKREITEEEIEKICKIISKYQNEF